MLDDILKQIAREIVEEKEDDFTIEVAILDQDTRTEFLNWKREKQMLRDEMKIKKQELELRVKREMEELFDERIFHVEAYKEKIWNSIYEKNNLDKDKNYSVDVMNNKIFMQDSSPIKKASASNKFMI